MYEKTFSVVQLYSTYMHSGIKLLFQKTTADDGDMAHIIQKQEAFEKCWAHSQLRAAARRLFYIAIHQMSLLSHAACASMSTTTMTTTTTRDRGDRYGPIEWDQ